MRQLPATTFIFLFALLLAACGEPAGNSNRSQSGAERSDSPSTISTQSTSNSSIASSPNRAGGGGGREGVQAEKISLEQADGSQNPAPAPSERKIIRNANLTLETAATEEAGRKIAKIAEQRGGFVVTSDTQARSDQSGAATGSTVNLVVRVPAAQFDAAVEEIRQTASRVLQEKVSGQDVTEEFIDLEAHLKTKKALEVQFLEIMKTARTVSDALEVQTQLAEVRGEIEKLEGRHKFLESQTSLSTVNITLNPPAVFAAGSNGFFHQLGRAFSNGIDAALTVVLFLITAILALLPIMVLIGVPIWLIFRYFRRKIQRAQLAQQLAKED